jgi:hypothetical protein
MGAARPRRCDVGLIVAFCDRLAYEKDRPGDLDCLDLAAASGRVAAGEGSFAWDWLTI